MLRAMRNTFRNSLDSYQASILKTRIVRHIDGCLHSLLAIALVSLLGTTWLGSGAWLLLVAGLGLLQLRRVIERFDLVLIAAVTLGVVLLFPPLQTVLATTAAPRATVVVLSLMAGAAMMAAGTVFRLIYRILSALM